MVSVDNLRTVWGDDFPLGRYLMIYNSVVLFHSTIQLLITLTLSSPYPLYLQPALFAQGNAKNITWQKELGASLWELGVSTCDQSWSISMIVHIKTPAPLNPLYNKFCKIHLLFEIETWRRKYRRYFCHYLPGRLNFHLVCYVTSVNDEAIFNSQHGVSPGNSPGDMMENWF